MNIRRYRRTASSSKRLLMDFCFQLIQAFADELAILFIGANRMRNGVLPSRPSRGALGLTKQIALKMSWMCNRNIARYEVFSKSPDVESTITLRLAIEVAENNAKAWKEWSVSK